MKNFYIYSLGCKVNSYEIQSLKDALIQKGYHQVEDEISADYMVLNTCCVTNTASSKSRQKINQMKKANPNAKLIVMGCYVQGFKDEVIAIDGVNLIVGTKNRSKIIDYIDEVELDSKISLVEDVSKDDVYEDLKITSYFENTRAYLKIQDGCNNFCSYCIIPYVRGLIKSRDKDEVINEAKELVARGYKEIVLTGIHTGSYGRDLNNTTFSDLVEELLSIDGLYRLRISSIEESEIDDKLIYLLKTDDKLAKHLHMPLQAGSDHVLKLMNRKYDMATYISKVERIKNEVPNIAITTDIIVGFPQESEEDFAKTLENAKRIGYAKIHVFPFSSRKGTVAAKMSGQINGVVKKQRAHKLLELSDTLNKEYNEFYINKVLEVLIEEFVDGYYVGHTSNFIKIKFKDNNEKYQRNDIIKVRIISASESECLAVEEN